MPKTADQTKRGFIRSYLPSEFWIEGMERLTQSQLEELLQAIGDHANRIRRQTEESLRMVGRLKD